MRIIFLVTFGLLAGCASSVERVQTLRDGAPDWYNDRKTEISGEDYPSIGEIPNSTKRENKRSRTKLSSSKKETNAALALFAADPRSSSAEETPEEMLAWAKANKRAVERDLAPADHLTDEEVETIKRDFQSSLDRL